MRIFVTGIGTVCPTGADTKQFQKSVEEGANGIRPLGLFREKIPLPVGEIVYIAEKAGEPFPRTHVLALSAAREALSMAGDPIPEAIFTGSCTGGMHTTESHLEAKEYDKELFLHHGVGTIAEVLAEKVECRGPVISISTACSSGSAAIVLAMAFLRTNRARHVLAGGADSLCYLTYHGFNVLQLIDPQGAKPFDKERRGMNVGEGAAFMVLSASEKVPANAIAEILGGGLSCDAYHPTSPRPEGEGAESAIRIALEDAAISPAIIDYINLHGTGTIDNDHAEAKALGKIFQGINYPPASSLKGTIGHPLAAAGSIGTVASSLAIQNGIVPGNTGCSAADSEINLKLVDKPERREIRTALVNAFGFGGNNAALVIGAPDDRSRKSILRNTSFSLMVDASACLTGAGDMEQTLSHLKKGISCKGTLSSDDIAKGLPLRQIRRFKRLSRMAMALSTSLKNKANTEENPNAIFWSTGWGGLSETNDFLQQLFESDHRYASPTDFINSVHNAPAGHVAIHFKAKGPNITATGGDYSFEQALYSACLMAPLTKGPFLIFGADEYHPLLSPLFDPSVNEKETPADGGGALWARPIAKNEVASGSVCISSLFYAKACATSTSDLLNSLGGAGQVRHIFDGIFAGIPAACRAEGETQLRHFLSISEFDGPVFDYRKQIGEFTSTSATAMALAVHCCRFGTIFDSSSSSPLAFREGKGILLLGFGRYVTAVGVQA
jgi:3-oxoacyl-[acyl-carrier-protein] synthase-1/3-oxoacyl-[acyl-carrier-protein] synthase II